MTDGSRSAARLEATSLAELTRLDGRVALVTGGARGIGKGIALRLRESGALVIVADADTELGQRTAAELAAGDPANAVFMRCDMTRESEISELVARVLELHGHIDVVVNNAGIYPYSPALQLDTEEWDLVLSVDLRGPFILCREAGRAMVERGEGGAIINISSINAFRCPVPGEPHYDAAKAGIDALTRSLAVELGPHGVRVNSVAPGLNLTEGQREAFGMEPDAGAEDYPGYARRWVERMPLRRNGTPDDQARVVAFLASDAAAFITGQCIVVDGGALLV